MLTGCVSLYDPEYYQEDHSEVIATISENDVFHQTFSMRRRGLNSLELWVDNTQENKPQKQILEVIIFPTHQSEKIIFSHTHLLESIKPGDPIILKFPPNIDNSNNTLTISLSINQGKLKLLGKNADIYSHGLASLNNQPINSDLGFRTMYSYSIIDLRDDICTSFAYLWLVIPFMIVMVIPGSLILEWSGVSKDQDWGSNIALSIGLSFAILSILLIWSSVLRIRLNLSIIIILASILCILWLFRVVKYASKLDYKSVLLNIRNIFPLGIIFIIALVTRYIMVRDLVTPPWVDSIHHGLITHLILQNGGLPTDYSPYLSTEGYHSGFHSVLAFFIWISGLSIPQSMLWFGQALNACIVFSTYLFSKLFITNQKVAIFAGLAAGLLSPMPAYYTSWGRYPHLAGLIILPATAFFCFQYLDPANFQINHQPFKKRSLFIIACILLGGLLITHYRISAFFFCLLLAGYSLNIFYFRFGSIKKRAYIVILARLFLIMLISFFLVAPWLTPALNQLIFPRISAKTAITGFPGFPIEYLTSAYGKILIALAISGWLIGLLQKRKSVLLLSVWIGLLFFLANLSQFKLPGGAYINSNSVGISLFLPISVFAGVFVSTIMHAIFTQIPNKARIYSRIIWSILLITISLLGAKKITPLLNPTTFLSRQADLQAMEWIEKYIPMDETIMINPFLWGYGLYAGYDGGYWITPITGRKTLPPPVLYGFNNDKESVKNTNQFLAELVRQANQPDALAILLRDMRIEYLYLGARGGIFSPAIINQSNDFDLYYHRDGVWIYRIKQ